MTESFKNEFNKFSDFMCKNSKWIFPILAAIPVCIAAIFKFVEYIHAQTYSFFYGMDLQLYDFSSKSFSYNLWLSFFMYLPILSILYSMYEIKKCNKDFKKILKRKKDLLIILVSNIVVSIILIKKFVFLHFIILIVLLFIIEYAAASNLFKEIKEDATIKDFLKQLPLYLFILIFLLTGKYFFELLSINDYYIINNSKAVIYTTSDYYVTLDCEIKLDNDKKKIIIYKGTQTKIDNTNVNTVLTKFDKVCYNQDKC